MVVAAGKLDKQHCERNMMDHNSDKANPPKFWGSKYSIGYLVIGAVAAYFLFTEHYAHTIAVLPFLLILACPLMHLFMHSGHHHEHRDSDVDKKDVK